MGDLRELGGDLLPFVWRHLLALSPLDNVATCCRDISALALTCRWMKQVARTQLWPSLGAKFSPAGTDELVRYLRTFDHYEKSLGCSVRRLEAMPGSKALAMAMRDQAVPSYVPSHLYHEATRLRTLAITASNAKQEFLLAKADLDPLPSVERSRGEKSVSHMYLLSDLLAAARAKHSSALGLGLAKAAREREAARRKRAAEDASSRRREELEQELGTELSAAMLELAPVQRYLKVAKAKQTRSPVVALLQLVDFAQRHADYDAVRNDVTHGRWLVYWNFGKDMGMEEEEDVVRVALRRWARRHGGAAAALGKPEVPAGLRPQLERVINSPFNTQVEAWFYKGGGRAEEQQQQQQQQEEDLEEEDEEQWAAEWQEQGVDAVVEAGEEGAGALSPGKCAIM